MPNIRDVPRSKVGNEVADSLMEKTRNKTDWDAAANLAKQWADYKEAGWNEDKNYTLKQLVKIASEKNPEAESFSELLEPIPYVEADDIDDLVEYLGSDHGLDFES